MDIREQQYIDRICATNGVLPLLEYCDEIITASDKIVNEAIEYYRKTTNLSHYDSFDDYREDTDEMLTLSINDFLPTNGYGPGGVNHLCHMVCGLLQEREEVEDVEWFLGSISIGIVPSYAPPPCRRRRPTP